MLTIVDHGSRWADAYAIPDHQAVTMCKIFCDYMSRFGESNEILHDLGSDFTSDLFQAVLKYFGVTPLRCSLAHCRLTQWLKDLITL